MPDTFLVFGKWHIDGERIERWAIAYKDGDTWRLVDADEVISNVTIVIPHEEISKRVTDCPQCWGEGEDATEEERWKATAIKWRLKAVALEQDLAKAQRERPYWLLHSMAQKCAVMDCQGDDPVVNCSQTELCITEWCVSCASRAWMQIQNGASEE